MIRNKETLISNGKQLIRMIALYEQTKEEPLYNQIEMVLEREMVLDEEGYQSIKHWLDGKSIEPEKQEGFLYVFNQGGVGNGFYREEG